MENGGLVLLPDMREGRQDGYPAFHGARSSHSVDKGTPYEVVPLDEGSSSSGRITSIASFFLGWGGLANSNAQAEGHCSAEGTSGAGTQSSHYSDRPKSGNPEHPPRVLESTGAKGDYSRNPGDLPLYPAQRVSSTDELKVSDKMIASLENHNKELEQDLRKTLKKFHSERLRADALEEEVRGHKREVLGRYQEKVRAEAYENEIRKCKEELQVLQRAKVRADAIEKENRLTLHEHYRERERAICFGKEIREYQAKLKTKEDEVRELQSKLQDALAAKEVEVAESKTLRIALEGVILENQELNSWKLERERKAIQGANTAGQFRTKVADLTYAKAQAEKKEQQLRIQVQEQTKRIEDLRQQNEVLAVKMGASGSLMQSLFERLRDEKENLQQKSAEVEELKQQMKPQAIIADKGAQVDDQEARALKVQCSVLEQRVQTKELETQTLSLTISKLNERLRRCDLEIDDLKHQLQDRENRDSQEFVHAAPERNVRRESPVGPEATSGLLDRALQRNS